MATRVFEKPVSRDMLDLQRSIAITANGNTHAAISTGQFVYVKNHSTLTDGLYVATDDIVEDGTLSSSNLTADTSGGLNALQGQINANSAHIDNLQDGLAIVSDNNTHAAIASGQFVYVKNHGTLDEGIYKATAAIAQDETISSSNLMAVTDGGLNAVKSAIPAVVDNLTSDSTTSALSAAQGKALNSNLGLITKSIIIGSGWSLSSAIINELGAGRVKGIVAFTCTGNLPTDLTGYGLNSYGEGYVVCNDYYQALWYSDTSGGIFTGYKVYSDTAWAKVQRIDNSIREYSMSASAEIPTTTELHNFFANTSVSDGTYIVSISTSSGVRSALIYTQASRNYGAGLLISYYNSSWYKVKNTNGTVTITAF